MNIQTIDRNRAMAIALHLEKEMEFARWFTSIDGLTAVVWDIVMSIKKHFEQYGRMYIKVSIELFSIYVKATILGMPINTLSISELYAIKIYTKWILQQIKRYRSRKK